MQILYRFVVAEFELQSSRERRCRAGNQHSGLTNAPNAARPSTPMRQSWRRAASGTLSVLSVVSIVELTPTNRPTSTTWYNAFDRICLSLSTYSSNRWTDGHNVMGTPVVKVGRYAARYSVPRPQSMSETVPVPKCY